jgi:hypothetical protein
MDTDEARALLAIELQKYRMKPYAELIRLIDEQDAFEITTLSGTWYQIEIMAVWDGKKGEDIRIIANIDDGGHTVFHPMSSDFILSKEGKFIGE